MTTNNLEALDLDQLKELQVEVGQQIQKVQSEKKVLVWRVITHDAVATNYHAYDYEAAIDWMVSQIREYATRECADVVEEGASGHWGIRGMNPQIPYITPHWVPESEYLREWENQLQPRQPVSESGR